MNSATAVVTAAVIVLAVIALYFTVRSFRSGGCSGCGNKNCCCCGKGCGPEQKAKKKE